MPMTGFEIDIEDELWNSAVETSGISAPSALVILALQEMLDRLKRQRGETGTNAP
jgi:Arc/MetJ family transcription regulator